MDLPDGNVVKLKSFSDNKKLFQTFGLKYLPLHIFYEDGLEKFVGTIKDLLEKDDMLRLFNLKDKEIRQNILDRDIEVIEQKGSLNEILDVFERINTRNTKLNIFDIIVAKTYKKLEDNEYFDLRTFLKIVSQKKPSLCSDYLKEKEDLDEANLYKFLKNEDFLFSVMLFLQDKNKKVFRQKDMLEILTYENMVENMRGINKKLAWVIDKLEDFSIFSKDYKDFKPIIKFISALNFNDDIDTKKLKKWFWNTVLYNRYPGSQNEKIQKDFENFENENFENMLKNERTRDFENEEIFLEAQHGKTNKLLKDLNILILNNNIKDFRSETVPSKDSQSKSKLELHHIFPKNSKIGKEQDKRKINSIINLTPVTSDTNRFIYNKNPSEYIKEIKDKEFKNREDEFKKIMNAHFINEEALKHLERDNFESFYIERLKTIKEKIREITKVQDGY